MIIRRQKMNGYVSYKKLWKILIDRDMSKKDLRELTGVSTASIAKMTKGENINTIILVKICHALKCNAGDIMDILPLDGENEFTNEANMRGGFTNG